jgi:glycosyltransferase involved in cell wall biosynthesis
MLSICFIDAIDWDYNVDAPTLRPFGGSQSALCYLAIALAKMGHDVTLLSNTSKPGMVCGVNCINRRIADPAFFASRKFEAVIVLNGPAEMSAMRWNLPHSTMLALWTQHAVDQRAMQGLSNRNKRNKWDHIICVSDWQRQSVIERFRVDAERVAVLRNAIAPSFEHLFSSPEALLRAKAEGLRLTYTSTPFRGLDVLLEIFPLIKAMRTDVTLEVYSSMAVYQQGGSSDPYASLYEALRLTSGIKYIGSLPQTSLATALSNAHILSYPNTFAETSCISVMEALAAGLCVVTSDFGALPETSMGYARLVSMDEGDRAGYIARYRETLSQLLATYAVTEWAERHYRQASIVSNTCTW